MFVAMVAFSIIGNTPLAAQPMVIGALVDLLGLSQQQAGLVASAELAGLSVGILAMLPLMRRERRMQFGLFSVLTLLLATGLTALQPGFGPLLAVRFCAGIGAAAAFSIYLNIASAHGRPERVFATVGACTIVYTGLINMIAPDLLGRFGFSGLLGAIAAVVALGALTLPGVRAPVEAVSGPTGFQQEGAGLQAVMALLVMMLLLYAGHGAVWAYQERMGVAGGLQAREVGMILGFGTLLGGLSGSVVARMADIALGRVWPQYISLSLSIVAVAVLVMVPGMAGFAVAAGLIAFSWFYGLPYQMGMLAMRDVEGRAASAGLLASTLGMALGPLAGAMLVNQGGHEVIGFFAASCYLVAMAIAVSAAKQIDALASRP